MGGEADPVGCPQVLDHILGYHGGELFWSLDLMATNSLEELHLTKFRTLYA